MRKRSLIVTGLVLGGAAIGVLLAAIFLPHISSTQAVLPAEVPMLKEAGESASPIAVATPAPIRPQRLNIPKLGITAAVEQVGLDAKKNMDVPKDHHNVAWYQYGPVPGEVGNSVIAGHLDSETGPAVFYNLANLQQGDEVQVVNEEGEEVTFRVTDKKQYRTEEFPIEEVFGKSSSRRLNLITCTGSFDKASRNYSHRTVVYTEKVES